MTFSVRLATVSLCLLTCLSSACSSEKSDKLSRSTAMELIKNAVEKGKISPPNSEMDFAPPAQIDVSTPERPNWVSQEAFDSQVKMVNFKADMLKWMESVGWIKETKCTISSENAHFICYVSNRPDIPYEKWNMAGYGNFRLRMTKLDKFEITGINQEAGNAIVELTAYFVPTEFYLAQQKSGKVPPNSGYFEGWSWPPLAEVTRQTQWGVRFAKYDDGWRIVNLN